MPFTYDVEILLHTPEAVYWQDVDDIMEGRKNVVLANYEKVAVVHPQFFTQQEPDVAHILHDAQAMATNVCGRSNWRKARLVDSDSLEWLRSLDGGDILVFNGKRYIYTGYYGECRPLTDDAAVEPPTE